MRTKRTPAAAASALLTAGGCASLMGGCVEERVVGGNIAFASLPGAQTNLELPPSQRQPRGRAGGADTDEANAIRTSETGDVTYAARDGGDLLRCIIHALENGHRDEFTRDILGERTRDEFLERGLDPAQAFDRLKAREYDIRALFARMPSGELTPGARIEEIDRNLLRVRPSARRDIRWNFMDMEFDRGIYRLRWFGRQ